MGDVWRYPGDVDFEETDGGLLYAAVEDPDLNGMDGYSRSVAMSQLSAYGAVFIGRHLDILDDEYEVEEAHAHWRGRADEAFKDSLLAKFDPETADVGALLAQFDKEYGFLHEAHAAGKEVAGEREAFQAGDYMLAIGHPAARLIAQGRGDSLDSSEEVAAFAFAMEGLGYI